MRAMAGDSGAARLRLWAGFSRAALKRLCLWRGALCAWRLFNYLVRELNRATVSHTDIIGAYFHAETRWPKLGLRALPYPPNSTRAPAPIPLCARPKALPFQRGAYEASPQAQPRRAAIVYGRKPMVHASKQREYHADTHLPSLNFRCWRTGPRRAFGAVAACQPLRLWRAPAHAALKRGFLWQEKLCIWAEKDISSFFPKYSESEHLRCEGAAPPSPAHHKRTCTKSARAGPCHKHCTRRAATASHTHFFRREKAARRAYAAVGLGAEGGAARAAAPAGLRPLGCAHSPRVFLKNRSQKTQSRPF